MSERPGEVLFEFHAIGATVKVTALDAATGIEICAIGPASAARHDLMRLARRKLEARLSRDAGEGANR